MHKQYLMRISAPSWRLVIVRQVKSAYCSTCRMPPQQQRRGAARLLARHACAAAHAPLDGTNPISNANEAMWPGQKCQGLLAHVHA